MIVHDPPGGSFQNSYSGVPHPADVAVKVTIVPAGWGEAGDALMSAEVHVPTSIWYARMK
jgi:hypothetical protein